MEKYHKGKRLRALETFETSTWNETQSPFFKLAIFLIGFLGLNVLAIILSLAFSHLSDKLLANSLVNFLTYLILVLCFALILLLKKDKPYKIIIKGFKEYDTYVWAIVAFFAIFALNYIFSLIYTFAPDLSTNANQEGVSSILSSYPAIGFFMVVVFAPIVEEMTYRLGLLDLCGKNKRLLGIVISSLLFGLIHFDYSAVIQVLNPAIDATEEVIQGNIHNMINEFINLPYYVFSGAILSLAYAKTGKISTSMVAHCFVNLYSFITTVL